MPDKEKPRINHGRRSFLRGALAGTAGIVGLDILKDNRSATSGTQSVEILTQEMKELERHYQEIIDGLKSKQTQPSTETEKTAFNFSFIISTEDNPRQTIAQLDQDLLTPHVIAAVRQAVEPRITLTLRNEQTEQETEILPPKQIPSDPSPQDLRHA